MKNFIQNFSLQFRELLEALGFKFYEVKPPTQTGKTVYHLKSQNKKLPKGANKNVKRHEQYK